MTKPRDLPGSRVLITGAASGIGRALALAVTARGATAYLTDRNATALAAVAAEIKRAGGKVAVAETADVRSYDDVQRLGETVMRDGVTMDVVMNVAGIAAWGTVDRLEHHHWQDMVEVNLMGPIHVIETFVPPMITAGRGGRLVNVSSAAGLLGLPWHAAYSASKFGLRGVSEVLRTDLRPHGIRVHLVCPGAVDTGLTETIQIAGVDTSGPQFRRLQKRFRRHAASPEQVAEMILDGMRRDRYLIHTANDIRVLHLLQRWVPPAYVGAMRVMHRVMQRELGRALT